MRNSNGLVVLASALVALLSASQVQAEVPVAAAPVAESATGVDFVARKGLSAEVQAGGFFAFAGALRGYSNFQAYAGVSIGFDLSSMAPGLSGFASAGMGPNAGDCRSGTAAGAGTICSQWEEPARVTRRAPEDFSYIPVEVGARYTFTEILPRFTAYAVGALGASFLTPQVGQNASLVTPHLGLGAGVNFDTQLEGISVGAEVLARVGFLPIIPSLAVYPRIRYTF